MDKGVITKIIEAANQAPSGGNTQPWKFVVEHDTLKVILFPEKDHVVLNYRNRGTYVAFGALLENVKIAAQSLGYEAVTSISLEPISAKITFQPLIKVDTSVDLYDVISRRHSNRKPYKTNPLPEETKSYILHGASSYSPCRISLVEGEAIHSVAAGTAFDLYVFLQNKLLHKLLFDEMLWKEEDQHTRSGLYIKTIEAAPPKSFVLKLLSHWGVAQFFNKIKLSRKIYEENAKTLSAASLYGAVIVPNNDESFVQGGRLIEDIWLRATKQGLSFQLVAGLVFLSQQMSFGKKELFSQLEAKMILDAYETLREAFNVKEGEVIAATFRVGEAPPPMAVSYKRPPEVHWV